MSFSFGIPPTAPFRQVGPVFPAPAVMPTTESCPEVPPVIAPALPEVTVTPTPTPILPLLKGPPTTPPKVNQELPPPRTPTPILGVIPRQVQAVFCPLTKT